MVKVYGINDETLIVEEDGFERELPTEHNDVRLIFNDGTVITFKYSVRRNKVWTVEIEDEGYSESDLTDYEDRYANIPSDSFEIDADLSDYELF